MLKVARRVLVLGVVVGAGCSAGRVFADDAADAKKVVEGFLTAVQAGDEKGVKGAVTSAAETEKAVGVYLDLMVATAQLQKAALAKFGSSAATTFGTTSGPALEARVKAIKEAPIKVTGESAILTMAADEAGKGGMIVLKKSGGAWKLDGASLFNLSAENKEATAKNVVLSVKLLAVTKQMMQEINDGKYAAAVDAFQEFWSRSNKAAKEAAGEGSAGASTQKGEGVGK